MAIITTAFPTRTHTFSKKAPANLTLKRPNGVQTPFKSFQRPPVNLYPADGEEEHSIRSLPEIIEFNAQANPDHLFCIQATKEADGGSGVCRVSNHQLRNAVANCERWLQENVTALQLPALATDDGQVQKGRPVALLMDSGLGLFLHQMALIGLGVPVLLLSARLSATAIHHLLKKTNAAAVLASPRHQGTAAQAVDLMLSTDERTISLYKPVPYATFLGPAPAVESICHTLHFFSEKDRDVLILHSSGTTGLPKPIYVSHRHLLCFTTCHAFETEQEAQGINVSTLPLYHGYGLMAPALAMGAGKTVCFPPPGTVPSAHSVIRLIKTTQAASLMSVPSILEEMTLAPHDDGVRTLAALDFVTFGGGILPPTVGDRLVATGVKILNHYGTTESGPLSPFFVPPPDYNWHYFRLRRDMRLSITEIAPSEGERRFRLTTYPFGWDQPFEIQDQLVCNPEHPTTDFNAVGRTDDLIVLATGEKVLPQILESLLVESGLVKSAIAFGDHHFEIGVIIEPTTPITTLDDAHALKETVWPVILRAGEKMDDHAKVSSPEAVIVVSAGAVIPRTDKGSIARKEVYKLFEAEISQVYYTLETRGTDGPVTPLDPENLEQGIIELVQTRLHWAIPLTDWSVDDDFFERGMDSLQAMRLRRFLLSAVSTANHQSSLVSCIGRDFVYANPSVRQMADALRRAHAPTPSARPAANELLPQLVQAHALHATCSLTRLDPGAIVVLTGSTGSLGSHCLAELVKSPHVARVICLNRSRTEVSATRLADVDGTARLSRALADKRIALDGAGWSKIQIYETNLSADLLGLSPSEYAMLQSGVTHIVHTAWPMDFKWQLSSFRPHLQMLHNLLRLAQDGHIARPTIKPRLLFVSSIATVGRYALVRGERIIPESPMDTVDCANSIGYAEAKLACEWILEQATREHPEEVEVCYVRLGQIAGARSTGFWNPQEHFPALVKSSQLAGALPQLQGTLSWIPVDDAARVLINLALSEQKPAIVYHLENPVRQSWSDILSSIGTQLDIVQFLPFEGWLDRITHIPSTGKPDQNPVLQLEEFFRQDFVRMACGAVIMATDEARRRSETLRRVDVVPDEVVASYVQSWRKMGYLS
ncbi:NRPS-like enzyme [Aspergillus sclerotioniger CBS 115572]|uniref:NRPS-like enzyme n=1 Tax=Aspergillus sclerotioniger CBS 115572 TaxID=1450535 RepID=A0A317VQ64_9EURO|nr:NRPS-like enzyme [Aspergillus sclerotioniger CBS 115572]PWY76504.1 NRPS-like enzyme [Aspergillus sclerotioniger CBS 115572]